MDAFGFSATVRLRSGNDVVEWPARFARVSDTVDPKTRTIGAIVAVDGAYAKDRFRIALLGDQAAVGGYRG